MASSAFSFAFGYHNSSSDDNTNTSSSHQQELQQQQHGHQPPSFYQDGTNDDFDDEDDDENFGDFQSHPEGGAEEDVLEATHPVDKPDTNDTANFADFLSAENDQIDEYNNKSTLKTTITTTDADTTIMTKDNVPGVMDLLGDTAEHPTYPTELVGTSNTADPFNVFTSSAPTILTSTAEVSTTAAAAAAAAADATTKPKTTRKAIKLLAPSPPPTTSTAHRTTPTSKSTKTIIQTKNSKQDINLFDAFASTTDVGSATGTESPIGLFDAFAPTLSHIPATKVVDTPRPTTIITHMDNGSVMAAAGNTMDYFDGFAPAPSASLHEFATTSTTPNHHHYHQQQQQLIHSSTDDNGEEDDFGDFAGFAALFDNSAAAAELPHQEETPRPKSPRVFEVTAPSDKRFSFYSPTEIPSKSAAVTTTTTTSNGISSHNNDVSSDMKETLRNPYSLTNILPTDGATRALEATHHVAVSTTLPWIDDSKIVANLTESLRKQQRQQQQHSPAATTTDKDAPKAEYEKMLKQAQEQTRAVMERKHRVEMAALRKVFDEKESARIKEKTSSLDHSKEAEKTAMVESLQRQITTLKQTHSDELIKRDALLQKTIYETKRSVRVEMEHKLQHAKFEHQQALEQNTKQWQSRLEQTKELCEPCGSPGSLQEELRKEREAHAAEIKAMKRELDRARIISNGHASGALQRFERKEKEWVARQREHESESHRLSKELFTLKESAEERTKKWEAALKTAHENETRWQEKYNALQQERGYERKRLNDQIQELRSTNQALRVHEAKLSSQVEHLEIQVQALADSLVAARGAGNAMEEALAKQKESYEEENKKIQTRLSDEKTRLEDELQRAQTSLQEKECTLQRAKAALEEQQQQLQFLSKREIKLNQTLQKSQQSATEWQNEIQLRDKLIERLRSDLLGRDGDLASMEKHLEETKAKLEEMDPNRQPGVNIDYLKDVVVKYLSRPPGSSERAQLLPVLATLLKFDAADYKVIEEGKQRLSWWGSLSPTLIASPAESGGVNESNKTNVSKGMST
eukprot:scaffold4442_cov125-Amphora_coffeaeformis.AAC.13